MAAPFFDRAKVLLRENFEITNESKPSLKSFDINSKLVGYSLSPTTEGNEINGIAYFNEGSDNPNDYTFFESLEFTLPPSQHELGRAILNFFIQDQKLN